MHLTPPQSVGAPGIHTSSGPAPASGAATPFNDIVQVTAQAAGNVEAAMANADRYATAMAVGEDVDIHSALIAMEQASIAVDMTLQIRNRALEAYREIMAMQV
ncbi:MAG TPA: flagellar hook-basal body complex protein FliE [Thermomicrobiales bacterium]|nr:flagellar hook-basal body complex protein FliE [Thermomicrobiales bacterium]